MDLDPVVLITYSGGDKTYQGGLSVELVGGLWAAKVAEPPQSDTYNFATTYSPFLTSYSQSYLSWPALVYLPAPGIDGFGTWSIYPSFTVTVEAIGGGTLNAGTVDFVPPFWGSSPYTVDVGAGGTIQLLCVQAQRSPYYVSVYDANGCFLYDSQFFVGLVAEATITAPSSATGPRDCESADAFGEAQTDFADTAELIEELEGDSEIKAGHFDHPPASIPIYPGISGNTAVGTPPPGNTPPASDQPLEKDSVDGSDDGSAPDPGKQE